MSIFKASYDQLVNAIIRPPRRDYEVNNLGQPVFVMGNRKFKRTDFEVRNARDMILQCSLYAPFTRPKKLPCVIYCHGNCGCRLDAYEAVRVLLPMNIQVLCFDFSGSGISEGEFVTLGHFEKFDLEAVVQHLRKSGTVTRIGLWGRSMGAVTSILYGATDPSIACMVVDSPFSSMNVLALELIEKLQIKVPKLMVKAAMKVVSRSVKNKAQLDINKLEPIKVVPSCFIPCLFAHGRKDDFIAPSHSEALTKEYAGDHNLILIDGDHNSLRPKFFYDSLSIFFTNALLIESDFGPDNPMPAQEEEIVIPINDMRSNGGPLDFQSQLRMAQEQSIMESHANTEEEQLRQAILLSLQDEAAKQNAKDEATPNKKEESDKKPDSDRKSDGDKKPDSGKRKKSGRKDGDKKSKKGDSSPKGDSNGENKESKKSRKKNNS